MSFWVYLRDDEGKNVEVSAHMDGGTYALGGTNDAELNVTYNYSKHFYAHLNKENGLRWLNDKVAENVLSDLERAVYELGTNRDSDYWKATEGNAGYALNILLGWAKEHPKAIFKVH